MKYQIQKLITSNNLHVHATWIQNWFFKLILCINKLNKLRINTLTLTCIA
jgi:hypothetical protein